ncbi:GNAT family N-acetyltransferase [Lacibacterium aquatile]|uniref:GNAT family N-acetyltransferase n=1 Tax=Lacibacterium aquatile TaxID=1168082 RepID=A0ABW5DZR0_9PROT
MAIRFATEADLPALLALCAELHPEEAPLSLTEAGERLRQLLRYPGSGILLADGGVATCTLVVIPNLTRGGAPYALIENVVTLTAHRKHGHGRAILQAAIAKAWEAGCYKVMLLTGSKNPATLDFYKGAGFEQSKTGFQIREAD